MKRGVGPREMRDETKRNSSYSLSHPSRSHLSSLSSSRVVIHVDMNAYFASVEQRGNPFLRGKPVLVVADSRKRSVVMTASYEARPFGVKTGMNLYEAGKLCPQAVIVDGNSDKYLFFTSRIMEILESFTDQVEMFSCDEAFLDVTGSLKLFGTDGEGIARLLKDRIKSATGLSSSVGVAPNKLLAKLASEVKKPDGLTVIRTEEMQDFLSRMPVEKLCGIGEKLKQKLNRLGIKNCSDLGKADPELLRNHFGFWGHWLKRMGEGKDDAPVKKTGEHEPVKSVGHSTTFPRDSGDPDILKSYLLLLSERAAFRLRQARLLGSTVTLTVRYQDFTTCSKQKRNSALTDDGETIYSAALRMIETLKPLKQPVRLLGVSLSNLAPNHWQEYLLETLSRKRDLNCVRDAVNTKFGAFTLKPARLLYAEQSGILNAPIPPTRRPLSSP